jgi:hypothetical protein
MRRSIAWIIAVAAALSSGEALAKGPPSPPPGLLATISLGPTTALDSARTFLDAVKPGLAMVASEPVLRKEIAAGVGVSSIDGLDWSAPLYVLVVDLGGGSVGRALVGKIKDEKALLKDLGTTRSAINGGWAVLAPDAVLGKIGSYALAALPGQAAATSPTVVLYLSRFFTTYRGQIDVARKAFAAKLAMTQGSTQMAQVTQSMMDGLISVLADTDQVVITLETDKDHLAVEMALVPKPRSRLAKFTAAQNASDYALLAKLPASATAMLMAGRIDSGPYRQGMLDIWSSLYGQGIADKDLTRTLDAIIKATTGDIAMTWQLGGGKPMEFTQVFGITDPRGVDQAFAKLLSLFKTPRTFESSNIATTIQTNPAPLEHDGVTLGAFDLTFDFGKATEPVRERMKKMLPPSSVERVGTVDKLGIVTMNADAAVLIDTLRGKGKAFTPDPAMAAILDGSRARKESLVLAMDLAALVGKAAAPQPLVLSFGFADRALHLRVTVPTATARALANKGSP